MKRILSGIFAALLILCALVVLNGNTVRSADTAAGKKSIAEKWALQWPSHDDRYYYRVCD